MEIRVSVPDGLLVWRNMRLLISVLALSGWVAGGVLLAQQTQAPASAPGVQITPSPALQHHDDGVTTLRTTARQVVVDVAVMDSKGRAVKGLKQSDFTLLEDGAPQTLASFQEHRALTAEEAAKADATLKLPPNHFTNYEPVPNDNAATVFLLDALDTPVQAQMYLRDQMIAYMKTVPAGTKIAIFQLDTQMHMIQGFTSDREVLQQVVGGKRNQPRISPLLGGPTAPGYVRERLRQQILTEGMQGLAKYLAPFPGRKNLIWFTARVPMPVYGPGIDVPFPDITSFIDDFSKTTDVLTLSRIAVYPIDARGLQTDPAFSAAGGGRGGRGGGLGFETRQFFQHGDLDDVAEATGGRAFYNTNGLKEAIGEVVDTGSNFYTLSYNPSNRKWDGSYRKLQVKLAQEGLHLEYRRGYFARNDEYAERSHVAMLRGQRRLLPAQPAANTPPPSSMTEAMKMGGAIPRDIVFLVDVTPATGTTKLKGDEPLPKDNFLSKQYRKDAYREYQIHYSVNARQLNFMPTPDLSYHGKLEFVALLYDDTGELVNSKSSQAAIDADKLTYAQMMQSGMGIVQTIAIPTKGSFFLRMGIHDLGSDKVGVVEVPVDQIKLDLPQSAAAQKP